MELKPETFLIGVIDFFSIMLPGAVVTYLAKADVAPVLFGKVFPEYTSETEGWAVFLFSSYLLGHFVFLIGSKFDDAYDCIRKASEGKRSSPVCGWLGKTLLPKDAHLAVEKIIEIKRKYLPEVDGKFIINAFQWAKARLTLQCPGALQEVHRFEADSKFFRSLLVVLLILAIALLFKGKLLLSLFCLALSWLSFWRYVERRFKATEQAYRYIITLEACPLIPASHITPRAKQEGET
ncbi:MAG TPA: hypothetical protein VFA74_16130 [Terriglobales bacterium]|nr:hypothetical protein [Terriglobales bacterium]